MYVQRKAIYAKSSFCFGLLESLTQTLSEGEGLPKMWLYKLDKSNLDNIQTNLSERRGICLRNDLLLNKIRL